MRDETEFKKISDTVDEAFAMFAEALRRHSEDERREPRLSPEEEAKALFSRRGYDLDATRHRNLSRWPGIMAAMRTDALPDGMGWLLSGDTGTGKSVCARLAAEFAGVELVTAQSLMFQLRAAANSEVAWNNATRIGTITHKGRMRSCDLIIDDLGRENPNYSDYGVIRNLMGDMLEQRLDLWPGTRTYIVTNLTLAEIESTYGKRVSSRLELATFPIVLDGPDRRLHRRDTHFQTAGKTAQ